MFKYGVFQSLKIPGPEIDLQARSPMNLTVIAQVKAIIDTAATITCIPRSIVEQLGKSTLVARPKKVVSGAFEKQTIQIREAYLLHITLANCEFDDLEVVIHDRQYAIVGRDILNRYRIIFDGLNQRWEVEAKCGE